MNDKQKDKQVPARSGGSYPRQGHHMRPRLPGYPRYAVPPRGLLEGVFLPSHKQATPVMVVDGLLLMDQLLLNYLPMDKRQWEESLAQSR